MPTPDLTPEQRAAALAKSNQVRKLRAAVRADLAKSSADLRKVLCQGRDDEIMAKMKVVTVLESLPGIGPVKAAAIMARLGISPSRRVRGLGPNQVAALLREFGLTMRAW